jgi:hypothetical protein
MKQLREIVGKGSLEAIIKHHGDAAKASKRRSDSEAYHSKQLMRAKRDKLLRDKKSSVSHVDLKKSPDWKRNLGFSIEDGKEAKKIKARIDAKGKK